MEHLMGPMAGLMKILGIQTSRPTLNEQSPKESCRRLNRSVEQLAKEENELLLGLLSLRAKHG
jgi:hypothetical protein